MTQNHRWRAILKQTPAEVSQSVGVFDIVMETPAEASQRVGVFDEVMECIQDVNI